MCVSAGKFSTPIRIYKKSMDLSRWAFRSSSEIFFSKKVYVSQNGGIIEHGVVTFFVFQLSSGKCVCVRVKSYFLWTDIGCATYLAFLYRGGYEFHRIEWIIVAFQQDLGEIFFIQESCEVQEIQKVSFWRELSKNIRSTRKDGSIFFTKDQKGHRVIKGSVRIFFQF